MDYPKRDRNHIIEEYSERFLKSHIPIEWVINKFHIDYGTDYNCEIASKEGEVTGRNFTIQLKGKEKESDDEFIKVTKIKRTTINRWLKRLEPTLIVVYVIDEKEAYWLWFKEDTVDLTKSNDSFLINIPRLNRFSTISWSDVEKNIIEIFNKKHLLYTNPKNVKFHDEKQAWNYYYQGNYEKSLSIFNELIKTDNLNALYWNAIAIIYYQLYEYKKALIAINNALNIVKDEQTLLLNKATILTEFGMQNSDSIKMELAKEIYESLDKYKNDYNYYYNYANVLSGLKLYEKAEYNYVKCLELNPNFAEAWKNLGTNYFNTRKHQKEIECYDNALIINPNLPQALFSKGITIFKVYNQVNDGLELMQKAIKNSHNDQLAMSYPHAFFWIAEAYYALKDIQNALNWNDKGLTNNPSDEYLLNQRKRFFTYVE
ncbi:MAG: DUF4365 domain-containing protein [Thermoflexibacter sp.]|jgi:tetratricopeptide (TPR) repeat protein|nr:DUF4365 domain-containing protein [Thermoflexibacter sp.]